LYGKSDYTIVPFPKGDRGISKRKGWLELSKTIRRTLIDIALRRQRPGTGSERKFLTTRTTRLIWPDLTTILEPIPWAVVGAVATRLYMPERVTQDLDIIIRAEDRQEVWQKLKAAGFIYQGELNIGGTSWMTPNNEIIDILESKETWLSSALSEAQVNRDAQGLPILPLPYLVLMKFQAGRIQDLSDITRMLGQANAAQLNATRALFAEYYPFATLKGRPQDIEDLESLIVLGQLEMQQPR